MPLTKVKIDALRKKLKASYYYDAETGEILGVGDKFYFQVSFLSSDKRYRLIRIEGKCYRICNLVWLIHHGTLPDGELYYVDNDTFNTRITNLYKLETLSKSELADIRLWNRHPTGVILNCNTGQFCVQVWAKARYFPACHSDSIVEASMIYSVITHQLKGMDSPFIHLLNDSAHEKVDAFFQRLIDLGL
jgi:hypothetical protein